MTAAELIAKLQQVDPDALVLTVDSEYGTEGDLDVYSSPAFADWPIRHGEPPRPAVILTRFAGHDDWICL